jgi:hypothetical protein
MLTQRPPRRIRLLGGTSSIKGTTVLAMSEPTETPDDWHRRFAVELYNAAWDLVDSPTRTRAEDDELLAAAFASRFHWGRVGSEEQFAVGDWFIGHVAAHLGLPELALRYSTLALERTEANGFGGWLLASAYEGMARANECAGNGAERERFAALCREALEAVDDPEEREVIEDQLLSVPNL